MTLTELLIAIGIICMLAAMVFPLVAKAKRSALSSKCGGNLRSVYAAIVMYRQDYGSVPLTVRKEKGADWTDAYCPQSKAPYFYHFQCTSRDKQIQHKALIWAEGEWDNSCILLRCPTHLRIPNTRVGRVGVKCLGIKSDGKVDFYDLEDVSMKEFMVQLFSGRE